MEKKDEFVEMRVRTIDEAMNVDKLIGHLTFDQMLQLCWQQVHRNRQMLL